MANELNKPRHNKSLKFPKPKNAQREELPNAEAIINSTTLKTDQGEPLSPSVPPAGGYGSSSLRFVKQWEIVATPDHNSHKALPQNSTNP